MIKVYSHEYEYRPSFITDMEAIAHAEESCFNQVAELIRNTDFRKIRLMSYTSDLPQNDLKIAKANIEVEDES